MNTYLNNLIAGGEGLHLDFKYEISDSKKIARTLSAFANTEGGRLLIGVKDNGKISGIRSDEEYYMLESAAQLHCKPEVSFTVKQWTANGKTILEGRIEKSNSPPHYARAENGRWMAYFRVGDENILANEIMIKVWRRSSNPAGTLIRYTDKEKILFDYLNVNETITLSTFQRIARITYRTAVKIMVNLLVLNLIKINFTDKKPVYSLKEDNDNL